MSSEQSEPGPHMSEPSAQTAPGNAPSDGWMRPEQMRASKPTNRLPWVLVAMLTALSIGLTGLLFAQGQELQRLRNQTTTATPSGAATGAVASAAPSTPSAQAVELMKKLPHRTPGDPTAMGEVDAPVVMVTWSDFRCPFCSVWSRTTLEELKPYVRSGSLRIEHRDLVLFGDESLNTAKAARAAGEQERFWQFYAAVHDEAPTSGHPTITEKNLLAFAEKAGVNDMVQFKKDYASAEIAAAVNKDTAEAREIGLTGTPFFIINTTPLSGAQPLAVFTQVIEGHGGRK
ncbi:DsbA family protein [Luteococcus sanguinis]|uniref:DsbA family protein n=1 Tax=Luteococcus sanguinis TaxID=174038 RepID=A0ABW1X3S6_9ACTN